MIDRYEVNNTRMDDLAIIFGFFDQSIAYQEEKGYPVWKNYDQNALIKDCENKNQFKIVIGSRIAIAFSICYSDKIIWRERDEGDALYLHRIVVNPACKGQKLFGKIVEWATGMCKRNGLKKIRMDTWATNPTIIAYYQTFGFKIIENYITPDSWELPEHNRNLALTLLEYELLEK